MTHKSVSHLAKEGGGNLLAIVVCWAPDHVLALMIRDH